MITLNEIYLMNFKFLAATLLISTSLSCAALTYEAPPTGETMRHEALKATENICQTANLPQNETLEDSKDATRKIGQGKMGQGANQAKPPAHHMAMTQTVEPEAKKKRQQS